RRCDRDRQIHRGHDRASAEACPCDEREIGDRHMFPRSLLALFAVWLLGLPDLAPQRPPTIAAAANLTFALTEIVGQFEPEHGARVDVVFGASGTLTRQIRDGAPFEMFLAADEEFPNQLTAAGLTRDGGAVYAIGRLVLFAPTGSPLMVDEQLDGLSRLLQSGGVTRFAIAH